MHPSTMAQGISIDQDDAEMCDRQQIGRSVKGMIYEPSSDMKELSEIIRMLGGKN